MNIHKDLQPRELVAMLERQQKIRQDVVIPMTALKCRGGNAYVNLPSGSKLRNDLAGLGVTIQGGEAPEMEITQTAFAHLAEKLQIPLKYLERCMKDSVPLFDHNINYWTARGDKEKLLIRTWLDEGGEPAILRAVLSDSYKMIDNLDILLAATEAVQSMGIEVKFDPSDLSEKGMYLRVIAPTIEKRAAKLLEGYRFRPGDRGQSGYRGDGICTGLILRNSEVGHAAFSIAPRLVIGACANGIIYTDEMFRHVHLGAKMDESVITWSDETKRRNGQVIISQIRDAVRKFLSPDFLGQMIGKLEATKEVEITNIQATLVNAGTMLGISEEKKAELLKFFTQGGDTSGFGLVQALTYASHSSAPEERWAIEGGAIKVAQPSVLRRIDVPKVLKVKDLPAISEQ